MPDEVHEDEEPFVSGDGINLSAPWRLADYFREGPLTNEQVAALATQFDLDPADIRRLSRALNVVLDRELGVELVPMRRSTAMMRGQERVRKALRDIVVAQERLTAGLHRLQGLYFENSLNVHRMWRIHDVLDGCQRLLEEVPAELEDIATDPRATLVLGPTDKRTIVDRRRDLVLIAIFHLWTRSGRSLTYTTDMETSKRRGPLIEFANAVVTCVTDPPSTLSGEMIVKGIRAFRHRNDAASVSIRFSDDDWDTWTEPLASFRVTESPTDSADFRKTSSRGQKDEWITPVHTWGDLNRKKRIKRDGATNQGTKNDPEDQTEPARRDGLGNADDH